MLLYYREVYSIWTNERAALDRKLEPTYYTLTTQVHLRFIARRSSSKIEGMGFVPSVLRYCEATLLGLRSKSANGVSLEIGETGD